MSDRDYYEIMGLTPGADGMMVDQAYWHLARKYQALAQSNPGAFSMLDELNEAYGVLGTSRLREQYDAFRDDVLIRKGLLKPVTSTQKAAKKSKEHPVRPEKARQEHASPRVSVNMPDVSLPSVSIRGEHWPWYASGIAVAAVLALTVWFGLSPLLVAGALVGVVALGATRALRHQLPAVNLTLPEITAPAIRAPRVEVPRLRLGDAASTWAPAPSEETVTPGDLRDSTAAMISRWRSSIGLRGEAATQRSNLSSADGSEPSLTLMDIVATEKRLGDTEDDEPLAAVIDILRGAPGRNTIGTR